MNLIDVHKQLNTEEKCSDFLERMRWPDGLCCIKCGVAGRISKFTSNETTRKRFSKKKQQVVTVKVPGRRLYECLDCGHQFSVTTGTIFNDTHLPLEKWFTAIAIICEAKKGVSACQMQRHLGCHYRTAWHLCHRIREAMKEPAGILSGTVEVDETYVGGKYDKRRKRDPWSKMPVVGLVERKGKVQAFPIPTASKQILIGVVKDRVSPDSRVITDQWPAYKTLKNDYRHDVINHIKGEYVRGDVHTNTIENFWSLLKRGIIGSYHKVSIKHLDRYLAEFTYRFNRRDEQKELFAMTTKNLLNGDRLTYNTLTGSQEVSN